MISSIFNDICCCRRLKLFFSKSQDETKIKENDKLEVQSSIICCINEGESIKRCTTEGSIQFSARRNSTMRSSRRNSVRRNSIVPSSNLNRRQSLSSRRNSLRPSVARHRRKSLSSRHNSIIMPSSLNRRDSNNFRTASSLKNGLPRRNSVLSKRNSLLVGRDSILSQFPVSTTCGATGSELPHVESYNFFTFDDGSSDGIRSESGSVWQTTETHLL